MNTNLTLELKFKTNEGKTRNITLKNPVATLTAEQVEPAMEAIVSLDAFEVEGVNPYFGLDSARYVERVVTDIFDKE